MAIFFSQEFGLFEILPMAISLLLKFHANLHKFKNLVHQPMVRK